MAQDRRPTGSCLLDSVSLPVAVTSLRARIPCFLANTFFEPDIERIVSAPSPRPFPSSDFLVSSEAVDEGMHIDDSSWINAPDGFEPQLYDSSSPDVFSGRSSFSSSSLLFSGILPPFVRATTAFLPDLLASG